VPTAETNGIVTHYEDTGQGPVVVLIHGHSFDLRMWKYQVGTLVDMGYRVVRYDVRGHGRSTVTESGYTWDNYSLDLAGLVKHLDTPPLHLVGFSMGGGIALKFALDHPGQTRSLTLVDSALPGFSYSEEFAEAVQELREAVISEGARAAFERLWLPHPIFDGLRNHPEKFREAAEMVSEYQAAEYRPEAETPGYLQPDLAARLGEIEAPALVMVGAEDLPDFRLIADLIAMNIRDAEFTEVQGCGHVPPMEDPQTFNRRLLEFLATKRD
jgi:pimeloyl-ACP methyl ester carboxylesterase